MIYIADRDYKDLQLNKYINKGAKLEEEYKQANIELTEERIKYLVEERKLYTPAQDVIKAKDKATVNIDKDGEKLKAVITTEEKKKKRKNNKNKL